jgi:hypothetical protein
MSWRLLAGVTALLLLACAPKPFEVGQCSGICGSVVDSVDGQPVSRFTVVTYMLRGGSSDLLPGEALSPIDVISTREIYSESGEFDLAFPRDEVVVIEVTGPGYLIWRSPPIGRPRTGLVAALESAPPIEGRVQDRSGHAISGASLWYASETQPLSAALWRVERDGTEPLARTAVDGSFRITESKGRPISVLVTAIDAVPRRLTLSASRKAQIVLEPARPFAGRVVDVSGRGVPRSVVEVRPDQGEPQLTIASSDGTFRFAAIPRRSLEVVASRELDRRSPWPAPDRVQGKVRVDLDLLDEPVTAVIPPSGMVRGHLPVEAFGDQTCTIAFSGPGGEFRFSPEVKGDFRLRLEAGSWQLRGEQRDGDQLLLTRWYRLVVVDGDQHAVPLTWMNPTTLRLRERGQDLTTELRVEPIAGQSTRGVFSPHQDGVYRLQGLEDGLYRASFRHDGQEKSVTFAAGQRHQIDVATAEPVLSGGSAVAAASSPDPAHRTANR